MLVLLFSVNNYNQNIRKLPALYVKKRLFVLWFIDFLLSSKKDQNIFLPDIQSATLDRKLKQQGRGVSECFLSYVTGRVVVMSHANAWGPSTCQFLVPGNSR